MTGWLDYVRWHRAPAALGLYGAVAISCACTRAAQDADRPAATATAAATTPPTTTATPATPAARATPPAASPDTQARTATLPPATACDGSLAVVAIRVVDAAGAPVNDAVIELKRVKDGTTFVRVEKSMSQRGDYPLIDDSGLSRVAADGEAFDAVVSSHGRKTVARLTIGRRPPGRCHVALLAGPSVVTLK